MTEFQKILQEEIKKSSIRIKILDKEIQKEYNNYISKLNELRVLSDLTLDNIADELKVGKQYVSKIFINKVYNKRLVEIENFLLKK